MEKFLVAYRNTPQTVIGVAPNKMVFKYPIKTKIPSLADREEEDRKEEDIRARDWMHKKREKKYADRSRNAKNSSIQVGDQVWVKQQREYKLSSKFESEPYEVIKQTGTEVMLKASHGGTYRQNISHLKNFQSNGNFKFDDVADSIGDGDGRWEMERANTQKVDDASTSDVDIGGNKDPVSSIVIGDLFIKHFSGMSRMAL